jgi:hypothetical protein
VQNLVIKLRNNKNRLNPKPNLRIFPKSRKKETPILLIENCKYVAYWLSFLFRILETWFLFLYIGKKLNSMSVPYPLQFIYYNYLWPNFIALYLNLIMGSVKVFRVRKGFVSKLKFWNATVECLKKLLSESLKTGYKGDLFNLSGFCWLKIEAVRYSETTVNLYQLRGVTVVRTISLTFFFSFS